MFTVIACVIIICAFLWAYITDMVSMQRLVALTRLLHDVIVSNTDNQVSAIYTTYLDTYQFATDTTEAVPLSYCRSKQNY